MGGDLCEAKGPMLPPDKFRSLGVFDAMRRQVEMAHRYDTKFIKHTDGFVDPLLDDLLNIAKIDGLHSLDPSAGVDIGEIKKNYGDKLILHGNISVDNLATKSPEEIIEETKNVIKVASPNGGHILSSSNSWYGGGKLENYLAMVEAGRKYGKYPIKVS
jgi:uroporphyrinogen decarboxylase